MKAGRLYSVRTPDGTVSYRKGAKHSSGSGKILDVSLFGQVSKRSPEPSLNQECVRRIDRHRPLPPPDSPTYDELMVFYQKSKEAKVVKEAEVVSPPSKILPQHQHAIEAANPVAEKPVPNFDEQNNGQNNGGVQRLLEAPHPVSPPEHGHNPHPGPAPFVRSHGTKSVTGMSRDGRGPDSRHSNVRPDQEGGQGANNRVGANGFDFQVNQNPSLRPNQKQFSAQDRTATANSRRPEVVELVELSDDGQDSSGGEESQWSMSSSLATNGPAHRGRPAVPKGGQKTWRDPNDSRPMPGGWGSPAESERGSVDGKRDERYGDQRRQYNVPDARQQAQYLSHDTTHGPDRRQYRKWDPHSNSTRHRNGIQQKVIDLSDKAPVQRPPMTHQETSHGRVPRSGRDAGLLGRYVL